MILGRPAAEERAAARKEEVGARNHHPRQACTCQQACTGHLHAAPCAVCTTPLLERPRSSAAAALAAATAAQQRKIWMWLLPMINEEDAVEGDIRAATGGARTSAGRAAPLRLAAATGEVEHRPRSSCDARLPDEDADICSDSGDNREDAGRSSSSSLRSPSASSLSLSLSFTSSSGSLGGSSGSLRGSSGSLASSASLDAELDRLARDGRRFGPGEGGAEEGEEEEAPSPSSPTCSGRGEEEEVPFGARCPRDGPSCRASGHPAAVPFAVPAAIAAAAPRSRPLPSLPRSVPRCRSAPPRAASAASVAALLRDQSQGASPHLPAVDAVWVPDVVELGSKPPGSHWLEYTLV